MPGNFAKHSLLFSVLEHPPKLSVILSQLAKEGDIVFSLAYKGSLSSSKVYLFEILTNLDCVTYLCTIRVTQHSFPVGEKFEVSLFKKNCNKFAPFCVLIDERPYSCRVNSPGKSKGKSKNKTGGCYANTRDSVVYGWLISCI